MTIKTTNYKLLDWDKPHFLDGWVRCNYGDCKERAVIFSIGEDDNPFGEPFCLQCARIFQEACQGVDQITLDEGILYKDTTGGSVLRGFPKEQDDD